MSHTPLKPGVYTQVAVTGDVTVGHLPECVTYFASWDEYARLYGDDGEHLSQRRPPALRDAPLLICIGVCH